MLVGVLLCLLFITLYRYFVHKYSYWKNKNVKCVKPIFPLGTMAEFIFMQKSITEVIVDVYNKYPDKKMVGGYRFWYPELLVRDPVLVRRVLVSEFAQFYGRGAVHTDYSEPLMRNLFFADGDLWRLLRQRMTPAFSSGKLRAMFPLVAERAERLLARTLRAAAAGSGELDARDLMARYTTDFIGACGFGLDADSLSDETSAFRKLGAKIFNTSVTEILVIALKELNPSMFRNLKYLSKIEREHIDLVKSILKQRDYKPSGRNDFIDLLLECRERGEIVCESLEHRRKDGCPEPARLIIDDELIAAQVFIFFAAGFETSSSATSFTLNQLAFNIDVQKKAQEEIDRVLKKYDNKLCYDAVNDMTYLEWTLKESLRMFPPLGYISRKCARTYTDPETNVSIEEGTVIFIPVQALHNDPKYFDNPEQFRPERFDPELPDQMEKNAVYMPFGDGPRACIGRRLGTMQSLAGLAAILSAFSVRPAPRSVRRPPVDPKGTVVQTLKHGLPLIFEKRNIEFKGLVNKM